MITLQPNGENSAAANNSTPNSSSSWSCKQTPLKYCKGWFAIAEKPKQKSWSYQRLATKHTSRIFH